MNRFSQVNLPTSISVFKWPFVNLSCDNTNNTTRAAAYRRPLSCVILVISKVNKAVFCVWYTTQEVDMYVFLLDTTSDIWTLPDVCCLVEQDNVWTSQDMCLFSRTMCGRHKTCACWSGRRVDAPWRPEHRGLDGVQRLELRRIRASAADTGGGAADRLRDQVVTRAAAAVHHWHQQAGQRHLKHVTYNYLYLLVFGIFSCVAY